MRKRFNGTLWVTCAWWEWVIEWWGEKERESEWERERETETETETEVTSSVSGEIDDECALSLARNSHSLFRFKVNEFAMNSHFCCPKFWPLRSASLEPPQMVRQLIDELKTSHPAYGCSILLRIKKRNLLDVEKEVVHEVARGDRHKVRNRKSTDRKAQIIKALAPLTELIYALRSADSLR